MQFLLTHHSQIHDKLTILGAASSGQSQLDVCICGHVFTSLLCNPASVMCTFIDQYPVFNYYRVWAGVS